MRKRLSGYLASLLFVTCLVWADPAARAASAVVRTLTYEVSGVDGTYTLSGVGSFDGSSVATTGDNPLVILAQVTVTFAAAEGGHLLGSPVQILCSGQDTAPVEAVADYGCVFTHWARLSDGLAVTSRQVALTNVTADATWTARFRAANPVAPNGSFLAVVDGPGAIAGRGWWDLTGTYATSVGGSPLTLDVVHDAMGRLTGTATLRVNTVEVTMPIEGNVRGSGGGLVATLTLKGATPARTVNVSLSLKLTLHPAARQLAGSASGSLKIGGATELVTDLVTLDVPAPMDGTWTLLFQLVQSGRGVAGTALLTLSNGTANAFTVTGRSVGATAVLSLAGEPADPSAKAIRIRTTMAPLEGGWGAYESLSATGYGQALMW